MNINKATTRDRKRNRRNRMVVENRNIFVLEQEKKKRSDWIRKQREDKQKRQEE